jgi:glutamyl-tRNA synthetase
VVPACGATRSITWKSVSFMNVRTRIAPSPTGDPHLGTAYAALFNLVFARRHGGDFVLRIEDTDAARSTRASEQMIFDALRWLGLDWDEGPDVGGAYGPYRQSERLDIYQSHVRRLVADGHAFPCFCSPKRLEQVRAAQVARGQNSGYDGCCMALSPDEASRRQSAGEPHVIRMKVPRDGMCRFSDQLRGEIEIPWSQVDMQVLQKTDGFPTYHLAVVVDDHLMQISHVLRGEEWINSVPKHVLLYQCFGWDPPLMYHLPLLRNPDSSKLSKRRNPTSINYYRRAGYLPEALLNYLGHMGWSMPDEREIFGLEDMLGAFDASRISLGGPIFDPVKLNWLNGQYIRRLTADDFIDRVHDWALNRDYLGRIVPLIQDRTERFVDLVPLAGYLVGDRRTLAADDFAHDRLSREDVTRILQFALWSFEALDGWERDSLYGACQRLSEALGLKIRDFLFPLFLAISGRPVALPLFDSMVVLGPDITRVRMRDALEALGGVSKKQSKKLEKEFRSLVDSPGAAT